MPLILAIESSSINCSVSVFNGMDLLSTVEKQEANIHASAITLFIEEALKSARVTLEDLSAIAVGKGPGSYTGLRIGVSTAKGLCYALNKPLIACNSLRSLTESAIERSQKENSIYCPLIDARRMEVYTCYYNHQSKLIKEVEAIIIDEHTFEKDLTEKQIIFYGDGANKLKPFYENHPNSFFIEDVNCSSKFMIKEIIEKYESTNFEDVIYFEPYYLKEFYFKK